MTFIYLCCGASACRPVFEGDDCCSRSAYRHHENKRVACLASPIKIRGKSMKTVIKGIIWLWPHSRLSLRELRRRRLRVRERRALLLVPASSPAESVLGGDQRRWRMVRFGRSRLPRRSLRVFAMPTRLHYCPTTATECFTASSLAEIDLLIAQHAMVAQPRHVASASTLAGVNIMTAGLHDSIRPICEAQLGLQMSAPALR